MIILNNNYIQNENTVISESSSLSGYPIENIAIPNQKKLFKFSGNTGTITIDLGSAKEITALCFGNTNLASGATVSIMGNISDSWGSPAYTKAVTFNHALNNNHYEVVSGTYRYWRISFNYSAVTNIEIGHLFIGTALTCPGWRMGGKSFNNTSITNITLTRGVYGKKGITYKGWSIAFEAMEDAVFNSMIAAIEDNQGVDPVYLLLYEGSLSTFPPYYVKIEADRIRVDEEYLANSNSFSLDFTEVN